MILVGQYDSPFVRRVAVSLHHLGLPFERSTISVFANAEEMRRINPLGRIPSLVLDGGEVLIDSSAILDHIDESVGPLRALLPPAGPERRRALRLVALACGAIDKAGAISWEVLMKPPQLQYQPWLERWRTQLASALAALEAEVGERWCLGERMMAADIAIGCMLAFLRLRVEDSFPPGRHPRLAAFLDRCEETAPFRLTRPASEEVLPSRPAA